MVGTTAELLLLFRKRLWKLQTVYGTQIYSMVWYDGDDCVSNIIGEEDE